MREFSLDRSITDGTELLVVRIHETDGDDEFVYARPVGQDAWFHFVGTDSSHRRVDPFSTDGASGRRETVEERLLDRGYPIRVHDGTTPPEGQLEVLTTGGTQARPFHTHPGTFVVYRDEGPTPAGPPSEDSIHVAILSRTDDELRVRVDAAGGPPPAYAIREAALAPLGHAQNPAALPEVIVEN